ncbi:unnamed protein product [Rotaria sp. Silwood1]|nr:unnamed protein product [Rotaria sp. Silwood1]CAF4637071.1 unnamed protein product [Rotaria sp. Silwood1]
MVHNCAIISCPLHNRRNIRKGLLFHSFPVDQHRFELWRQTVFNHCSQTLSINKHSKICYRHFHPDDYIANHTGLTRYLKATAIPSIFTQTNSNSTILSSTILNNHLLNSSTNSNTNRSIKSNTLSEISPSLLILPSKSSSSVILPAITNTKAKRLLNTIDKLHQIQNANKTFITQKITSDNEQLQQDDDDDDKVIEKHILKTNEIISDNNLSLDNSMQTSQSFIIDHQNIIKEQQSIQDTFQHSSIESDTFRWTENTLISLPKNHLEDALYKFLEQANLLQYYSAFIEQGGDDLKQLAEAQNDDFQEIITLVGMVSKPLHVKRFKKALADYRQSMNNIDNEHTFINNSYSTVPSLHRLSTDETLSDRNIFSSVIHSTPANNSPKLINQISSNWCLNKIDHSKNNNNNTHQLLDDNQRKMIADEAERLANILPVTTIKKLNGRNNISKDLFATINLPRDFEDRWQRIRKYSAIYNRFDSKTSNQVLSLHEILINEAAAAICFHRPEFLTRRDELLHLARRVLQNIGISTANIQKRPLTMLTCDITPAKQIKVTVPITKSHVRQRDSDAFRLMWHNRETKVEQIPIQVEALRCEQNKLLQQLKQNTSDLSLSSSIDNNGLKKQIDDIGRQIEQLNDEEKNLRRLIRKKNMRLRAKERQQQKQQMLVNHSSNVQDLILPIVPITPSSSSLPIDINHEQQTSSLSTQTFDDNNDIYHLINIKDEKIEPSVNLSSPVLKARKEFSRATLIPKPIDKRREEVNERLMTFNKKIIISKNRLSRSTERKQSSSTTAIEQILDLDFHSQTTTNILPTCHDEQDIIESKSFIHNLNFNINT